MTPDDTATPQRRPLESVKTGVDGVAEKAPAIACNQTPFVDADTSCN